MVQYSDRENWGIAGVCSVNYKIYGFVIACMLFSCHLWAQGMEHSHAGSPQPDPAAVSPSLPPLAAFRSLDLETELLVKEVLDLSSDLAIIQEEEDNPANHQLLVLVTFDPTKLFTLDYIQLEIDNEVVAAYQYAESDIQALKRGAGHRLYVANLPAGMHEVYATMVGRIPRDPDYKSEVEYKFISGVSRTVLELNVSSKTKGFPVLAIKEWN